MPRSVAHRAPRLVWRKLASAKWADAWVERLRSLDPARLAIIQVAGTKGLRLEYYCRHRREADALRMRFGGSVRPLNPAAWSRRGQRLTSRPLRFGGKLIVTGHEDQLEKLRRRNPRRTVLCIPAALAFGSGEHATTAMCLRMLVENAKRHANKNWEALDLGTGSGILAIAARALGAKSVFGFDYEPACVRTARDNVKRNHLASVSFAVADALAWKPAKQWNVITANLFMNVLLQILPKLRRALARDGDLILSGLLIDQAATVIARAKSANLELLEERRRGRWCALHLRPRAKRVAKRRVTR